MRSRNMNKIFINQARTLLAIRQNSGMSQERLGKLLGHKNGQFISNMERGLCAIPPENMRDIAVMCARPDQVNATIERLVNARLKDEESNIYARIRDYVNSKSIIVDNQETSTLRFNNII